MAKSASLVKNTAFLVVAGQASRLVNFFEVVLLVRYLGKTDYGIWNLSQSIPTMFFVVTDLGLSSIMLRRIAREPGDRDEYLSKVLLLKLLLAIPFLAAVHVLVTISHHGSRVALMIYISSVGYLVWSLSQVAIALFRAHQNFVFEAVVNTVKSALFLLLIVAAIALNYGLTGILVALVLSDAGVAALAVAVFVKKFGGIRFRLYPPSAYVHLTGQSVPFAVLAFFSPIFFQIGIIMLSSQASFEAVAIYSAPYKIMLFLFVIPVALKNALFPQLSKLFAKSLEEFRAHLDDAVRIAAVVAFPIAAGLFLIADQAVALLFSEAYAAAAAPLRLMALWVPLSFLRSVTGVGLYASNRERLAVSVFAAGTVVAVVLNFLLIPGYSYVGAAISSVVAEAVILATYYVSERRHGLIGAPTRTALRLVAASGIMSAGVYLAAPLGLGARIALGVVLYGAAAHIMKLVGPEERVALGFLRKKLGRRAGVADAPEQGRGKGDDPMRRLLVISPRFSLTKETSNVKRVKYLNRFGWAPLVVTSRDPTTEPSKTMESLARSFAGVHRTFCVYKSPFRILSRAPFLAKLQVYLDRLLFVPDLFITWVPSAYFRARRLLRTDRPAAFMTCSPPESSHIVGLLLKHSSNTVWVADFRDLWTTKAIVNAPPTPLHGMLYRWLEKRIYRDADVIVANTEGNRRVYIERFGVAPEKIVLVPNGYDPGEVGVSGGSAVPESRADEFRIGYMGAFDKNGFPWREFLMSFEQFIERHPTSPIRFNLLGPISPATDRFLRQLPVAGAISYGGNLPHAQAIARTAQNDILLILMYETAYSSSIVPHKLYHYIAMGKPILAIAEENGETAAILERTGTGVAVSISRPEKISQVLESWFAAWSDGGTIPYSPLDSEIRKYDIVNLTERVAARLDHLTSPRGVGSGTNMLSGARSS